MSPYGTLWQSGKSGSKGFWYLLRPVTDKAPMVLPWNDRRHRRSPYGRC